MRLRRPSGMTVLTAIALVVMAYLLIIPLATQLISSFRGPGLPLGVPSAQWTAENYVTLAQFGSGLGQTILANAACVGSAAILSTFLALALAWLGV